MPFPRGASRAYYALIPTLASGGSSINRRVGTMRMNVPFFREVESSCPPFRWRAAQRQAPSGLVGALLHFSPNLFILFVMLHDRRRLRCYFLSHFMYKHDAFPNLGDALLASPRFGSNVTVV